uniref:Putative secreted protein n=1 Tax=Aedes albopictus TaxID=7160 RepID=A0A023EDT7_AEDAL
MKLILLMIISVVAYIDAAAICEHRQNDPNAVLPLSDLNVQTLDVASLQADQDPKQSEHTKREVMFRPLFVYRQQEIKKQHLKEQREQREQQLHQHHAAPTTTTRRPQKLDYDPYDYMA